MIVGRNSLSDKFIRLRSDFVDADYEGKTSYKEVFAYLQQRFRDYVPMLDGGPGWQAQHPDTVELADGYSQLTVNVRKINPLVNAVSSGLQIAVAAADQSGERQTFVRSGFGLYRAGPNVGDASESGCS